MKILTIENEFASIQPVFNGKSPLARMAVPI